nr:MAG TPA: protein of unknown function DUF1660 [Caudoviricetes sp.]
MKNRLICLLMGHSLKLTSRVYSFKDGSVEYHYVCTHCNKHLIRSY